MVWMLQVQRRVMCMQHLIVSSCLYFLLVTSSWCCLAATDEYMMPGEVCQDRILRDKEAVVLKGLGERLWSSEMCELTLHAAHGAKWMFHVQTAIIMDCKVRITVYDSNYAAKPTTPVVVIGCASRDPGVIRLNSSTLTVRLYHKNGSDYSFSLLLTARNVSPRVCPWFKCNSGDCIPKTLMCDGVDNCFDRSDESSNGTAYCDYHWPFEGENWGVLASVLGVALILGVTAACCRQFRNRRDSMDELYDLAEHPYARSSSKSYAQKYAFQYRVIRHPNLNHSHHHSHNHANSKHHSHANSHAHSSHKYNSRAYSHSRYDDDRDRVG